MNSSFTKSQIHNYLIEQGFQFNNNKIPNASLLNHINNDRLTFARIYEVLLQNYIERWIHVKYNIPVHLKSQQQYYSMDYISNKNVYVALTPNIEVYGINLWNYDFPKGKTLFRTPDGQGS